MKSVVCCGALAALLAAQEIRVDAASTSGTTPKADAAPAPERTYPSLLPLTLQVSANEEHELGALREFTITAQREGDAVPIKVLGPVDPFSGDNTCTRPMPEGIVGCLVNDDATVGTLRVNWNVPAAGTYRFVLSAKRDGDRRVAIGSFDLEARD
jgi:hypothetical protein